MISTADHQVYCADSSRNSSYIYVLMKIQACRRTYYNVRHSTRWRPCDKDQKNSVSVTWFNLKCQTALCRGKAQTTFLFTPPRSTERRNSHETQYSHTIDLYQSQNYHVSHNTDVTCYLPLHGASHIIFQYHSTRINKFHDLWHKSNLIITVYLNIVLFPISGVYW